MGRVSSKYIIKLEKIIENPNYIILVIETRNASLFDYLNKKKLLNEETALELFEQILFGIKNLHNQNIIHHNIKLENILVTHNHETHSYDPIISSLSYAEILDESTNQRNRKFIQGTPGYIAPEKFHDKSKQSVTTNSDMFSLGCILFALVTGKMPFLNDREAVYDDILEANKKCQPNLSILKMKNFELSNEIINLIKSLLEVNPLQRITLDQALNHKAFELIHGTQFQTMKNTKSKQSSEQKFKNAIFFKQYKKFLQFRSQNTSASSIQVKTIPFPQQKIQINSCPQRLVETKKKLNYLKEKNIQYQISEKKNISLSNIEMPADPHYNHKTSVQLPQFWDENH